MNGNKDYSPQLMGIINVTPDSFSDGGQFVDASAAIAHGLQLVRDGADVLDIGGESTRPGSKTISVDEELSRVIPVIEGIRRESGIPISIDTRKAQVMREALAAGATMINDVSALTYDTESLEVVAAKNVPVCLMHMKGSPQTMQKDPHYENVVEEIHAYLNERVATCEGAGISKERVYIDVGIGFGKTLEHNRTLLRNLEHFTNIGTKMLLGTSRKRFIEHLNGGEVPADRRLAGSLASIVPGLRARVDMFRVHDVFETRQFIDMYLQIDHI